MMPCAWTKTIKMTCQTQMFISWSCTIASTQHILIHFFYIGEYSSNFLAVYSKENTAIFNYVKRWIKICCVLVMVHDHYL